MIPDWLMLLVWFKPTKLHWRVISYYRGFDQVWFVDEKTASRLWWMLLLYILLLLLLSLSLILYVIIMQSIFMGVLYVIKNECREPLALRTAWSPWMRISEWSAAKSGRIRWDRNGSTTGISRIGVMLVNGKCDFFIKNWQVGQLKYAVRYIGISSAEMGTQPKKKGKWLEGALLSQAYRSFINRPSVGDWQGNSLIRSQLIS